MLRLFCYGKIQDLRLETIPDVRLNYVRPASYSSILNSPAVDGSKVTLIFIATEMSNDSLCPPEDKIFSELSHFIEKALLWPSRPSRGTG